jgi:hypothetical protein
MMAGIASEALFERTGHEPATRETQDPPRDRLGALRGRRLSVRSRKPVWAVSSIEGSNPSLSAKQGVFLPLCRANAPLQAVADGVDGGSTRASVGPHHEGFRSLHVPPRRQRVRAHRAAERARRLPSRRRRVRVGSTASAARRRRSNRRWSTARPPLPATAAAIRSRRSLGDARRRESESSAAPGVRKTGGHPVFQNIGAFQRRTRTLRRSLAASRTEPPRGHVGLRRFRGLAERHRELVRFSLRLAMAFSRITSELLSRPIEVTAASADRPGRARSASLPDTRSEVRR